ncbi:hypothetical protein HY439_00655 [Candidatus Microgenomates bacterium]|nr:hypothetical protein [Candidatus Microgenomates bacterium]
MRIQFLWDEEKTRHLHKIQLTMFIVGPLFIFLYTYLLPPQTPYRLLLAILGILMMSAGLVNLAFINKPHQGVRLLILLLIGQAIGPWFMALSGGFNSIVQFAPFALIYISVFELGSQAAVILGFFSLIMFILTQVWTEIFLPQVASRPGTN